MSLKGIIVTGCSMRTGLKGNSNPAAQTARLLRQRMPAARTVALAGLVALMQSMPAVHRRQDRICSCQPSWLLLSCVVL